MKIRFLILVIAFTYISCSKITDKKTRNLVDKIDMIGINKFKSIEFGRRGYIHTYTYHFNDSLYYSWSYDLKTKQFIFYNNPDFDRFKNEVKDINIYADSLRNEINSLNVSMISQSPWIGNLIRFWISQTQFVSYVNPDFNFDTSAKKQWLQELNLGEEINKNWIFVDISSKKYREFYDKK